MLTGSSGILGTVISRNLVDHGYKVIGVDNQESNFESESYRHYHVDLSSQEKIESLCREIAGSEIYGLINNAAIKPEGFFAPSDLYTLDTWNKVIEVNLTAPMLMSKGLFPSLKANQKSSIINISSIYGIRAPIAQIYQDAHYPEMGGKINTPLVYSVTKTAILGLTRHLSAEWGKFGIRVNSITPGGVFSGQNDSFVKNYSSYTSLGRMADESDISDALLFLLGEGADYITGHNLVVDGGWTS